MPNKFALVFVILLTSLVKPAFSSVSEQERNASVSGAAIYPASLLFRYVRELDLNGNFNDLANQDASLANPLAINDATVAQLSGTRDYDWFYVDINDNTRPITPVYFGCDEKQGHYLENAPGSTITIDPQKDISYQVNYYYLAPNSSDNTPELQSSYVVGINSCRIGSGETIGHMRFQMNTARPGRYLVRIFGRYIDSKQVEDQITDPTDSTKTLTRKTIYDEIVTPTGDYSIRVYTARINGAVEPNDGKIEAYPLISGTSVSDQLASMYDTDWFYIESDNLVNVSRKIPFYFTCSGQNGVYNLSAYDEIGVLQQSFTISASQCSGTGGFTFTVNTPVTGRYYFVVSPPTYADLSNNANAFSQTPYTLLAISSPKSDSILSGTPTRLPGQMEPNNTPINAYPLTSTAAVTGAQIATTDDLDYYYYDNNSATNPTGTVPIYFRCTAKGTGTTYIVSYLDSQGILQKSYTVDASQCNIPGGFTFQMNTPATSRYYLLISENADNFSTADYSLSTFYNAAAEISSTTSGKIQNANINIYNNPRKLDSFSVKVNQCGTNKGYVQLTGKKLNLSGINKNTQVQVQIDGWSCTSSVRELTETTSNSQTRNLVFPAPTPKPTPAPKKPTITGTTN